MFVLEHPGEMLKLYSEQSLLQQTASDGILEIDAMPVILKNGTIRVDGNDGILKNRPALLQINL